VVHTPGSVVATIPLRSLDRNGGFVVNVFDFVGDQCNDYTNDGVVDSRDWDFFSRYLGQTCITGPADYFTVDLLTRPGPDSLFLGATIAVCARITNTSVEPATLDSVVFTTAGWGIANPWSVFDHDQAIPIGPQETVEVSVPFTIPSDVPRHGCFRATSYPSFGSSAPILGRPTTATSKHSQLLLGNQSNTRQVNRDSRKPDCRPPSAMQGGSDNFAALRNLMRKVLGPTTFGLPRMVTDTTAIPLGTQYGTQAYLYHRAFMPAGWSYSISDSGWVSAPRTITVTTTHPVPVACGDTGRVVVYAYAPGDVYAGDAEVVVYALGERGDVNSSSTVDSLDVNELATWLLGTGPEPQNADAMELNGDGLVDIADLVRLVDLVYADTSVSCSARTSVGPYHIGYTYANDSTYIYLKGARPIRGLQLVLGGSGFAVPISALPSTIEVRSTAVGESLIVQVADLDGASHLNDGLAFTVPGTYSIAGGAAADIAYGSSAISIGIAAVDDAIIPIALNVYPSPAHGRVAIHYAVPSRRSLRLHVYDIAGRRIKALMDGTALPGWHSIEWDRTDRSGERVSPGVYFVRMIVDGTEATALRRSLVLIQ
jgi:hypothetical protein